MRAVLSSIVAFMSAAVRPRTPLAKAIVVVLVIKLIGLAGIKTFLFPQSDEPAVTPETMMQVIGGPVIGTAVKAR
ncbi:MAG TPA: hypothetical protein VH206_19335 [Xanthobacteraceae bacterium]|jgi:hypothetical protein|nr:hypothetical protein [Xanthobacteraceae bacterium]